MSTMFRRAVLATTFLAAAGLAVPMAQADHNPEAVTEATCALGSVEVQTPDGGKLAKVGDIIDADSDCQPIESTELDELLAPVGIDTDECHNGDDHQDADEDGAADACDSDDDNDGVPDGEDACPGADDNDPAECPDTDGDGVDNEFDVCEGHDDNADLDSDGTPDGCDDDRDGDGVPNDSDADPDNPLIQ